MEYIDLTLQEGGSGVSNYNLLSNQPQINGVTLTGNKSSTDLGIFLPDGYTITVATDDSGDFTDLQSAIDSLIGKICVGTVTISIGAGSYNIASNIAINENVNCKLAIVGAGASSTSLNFTNPTSWTGAINATNTEKTLFIKDLAINNTSGVSSGKLAIATKYSNIYISNVSFNSWQDAIYAWASGRITCSGNITVNNGSRGIYAEGGDIYTQNGTNLIFTDVTTALNVYSGGHISCTGTTKTYTRVTNEVNHTVGTATSAGYICGSFS